MADWIAVTVTRHLFGKATKQVGLKISSVFRGRFLLVAKLYVNLSFSPDKAIFGDQVSTICAHYMKNIRSMNKVNVYSPMVVGWLFPDF